MSYYTYFAYRQPANREELLAVMNEMTGKSAFLAGGTDLICAIREKHPELDQVVDLSLLDELKGVEEQDGRLRIGAMTSHAEVAANPLVQKYFRALSVACAHVGSQQIRNKGTVGGNLMNASPAGDTILCFYLFEGEAEVLSPSGESRLCTPWELYDDNGRLTTRPGELLTAIWLPIAPERDSFFYKLGSRSEVTIAQISGAISAVKGADGLSNIRFFLGAVARRPLLVPEAAELLAGPHVGEAQCDALAELLAERIRQIRLERKKPPRLKITESERLYKERAVKSVVYDVLAGMQSQTEQAE